MTIPPLWTHQAGAIGHIDAVPGYGAMLAMDMGTGKSRCVVELCNRESLLNVLIICPKSVMPAWEKQFRLFGQTSAHVLQGTVAHRALMASHGGVVVVNYDVVWRPGMLDALRSVTWHLIVCDESHRISNAQAKCSAAIHGLKAQRRLALSGTPMGQSPLDIFSQYKFIDPNVFGTNWWAFLKRYAVTHAQMIERVGRCPQGEDVCAVTGCRPEDLSRFKYLASASRATCPVCKRSGKDCARCNGTGTVKGAPVVEPWMKASVYKLQNEADLVQRYRTLAYECKASDVLDLPAVMHETIEVELSPAERRVYAGLEKEMMALIGDAEVSAAHLLTRLLRLQQAACGHTRADEDSPDAAGEVIVLGTSKRDALAELFENTSASEPWVVFCRFRADLDAIHDAAKGGMRRCFELSGRKKELEAWQADDGGSVLAVQIQSGGVGIDLTRARYCAYFSVGNSLAQYVQSLARVHRPGQERPVAYYHLHAAGTIDTAIFAALQERREVIDALLGMGR